MTDLRQAVRTLLATPIVTSAAVLSLALGIGANTAIFGLINSLVLRTLPVADPERLAILKGGGDAWSNPIWEQLREHQQLVDGAFAWFPPRLNLAQGGEARVLDAIFASGRFFEVLGIPAFLGRTFGEADDQRGGGADGPVAVMGYEYWRRHFGGATDAVGQQLVLDGVSYTVIGVAPPGFFGPDVGRSFDVVVPLGTEPLVRGTGSFLDQRDSRMLRIILRLKPGQTLDAAAGALNAIRPQIRQATLPTNTSERQLARYLSRPFVLEAAASGDSRLRGGYQRPLLILLVVAGFVLLIACSNIANLLLARAAARRNEISVMRALGASRWQLARQYLIESLVLAGVGTALGLVFAQWTSRLLVRQLSTPISTVFLDLSLDWRMLVFTTAIGLGTAILFGVAPALRATRADPIESIKEQGRGSAYGGRASISGTLVVAQVALSLTLVVAAGLFLRTFAKLATLPLGFESDRLLVVSVGTRPSLKAQELPGIYARLRERAAAVPSVDHAAMSRLSPIGSGESSTSFYLDSTASQSDRMTANTHDVSPDFFATLGIPIVAGRDLNLADRSGSPRVAVVNQVFVQKYLGGSNPIGRRILQPGLQAGVKEPLAAEIVGVAGDAVYRMLRNPPPPTIYFALNQSARPPSSVFLHVRTTAGSPAALTRSLSVAIGDVHGDLSLRFTPMNAEISAALTRERLLAMLSGFFGALGVLLAGIGLFGVTSYAVTQRRAEISVRLAIGATPDRIIRLVLTRVACLVSTGLATGAILTWWLAQFVSATQLYGVEPRDLSTIAGAALLLTIVAVFAGWWPARRAARFDPAPLLREA